MHDAEVRQLIELLGLQPHPEGGFFRETYRAADVLPRAALPPRFRGDRSAATAIYYLLPAGGRSLLHRIASDETWHFYAGGPLNLVMIDPAGGACHVILGNAPAAGQTYQATVPAGNWFGAYPADAAHYTLAGCTVAPGFDFADFELGRRDALLRQFPQCGDIILRLTAPASPDAGS